jgi:hypothetical protein
MRRLKEYKLWLQHQGGKQHEKDGRNTDGFEEGESHPKTCEKWSF